MALSFVIFIRKDFGENFGTRGRLPPKVLYMLFFLSFLLLLVFETIFNRNEIQRKIIFNFSQIFRNIFIYKIEDHN